MIVGPTYADRLGLFAWHRRKLGWLRPTEARCVREQPLEVTLSPTWRSGGTKLVLVPSSTTSLIALENRQRHGLDAGQCASGVLAYRVRSDWTHGIEVLPASREFVPGGECGGLSFAPYDFRPKDSTTVAGVTFEVLDVLPDGSYRLRVTR